MKKIKKSLAVLLAVLMLASFTPLFASAAITINRNNVKIVPPSVSPAEITYGQTLADVTLTGGECWYVDPDTGAETLVPGHFEHRSTTTKPAVSDAYNLILKFVSDDTTAYSNITILRNTTTTLKSGTWPTLKVNGLDGTLVEAPTAADILTGQPLSAATLTGGVVNGTDGNAVAGTWSFVYPNEYPAASGKYEVQFKATGYNTLKTTVDVTVTSTGNATLKEAPTVQYYLGVGDKLSTAIVIGGKVVDDSDNEITTGSWFIADNETQRPKEIVFDKEGTYTYKAQWIAVGYPVVFSDVQVTVYGGYTVDKPTLPTPVLYESTHGQLGFVYGEASVPGTYQIANPDKTVSSGKNVTQSASVSFVPENPNYKPTSWTYSFKIVENDKWYTQAEEPLKIVIPYGCTENTASIYTAVSWPEYFIEQKVDNFWWSKDTYDIASMDVGEMILVDGLVRKSGLHAYANIPAQAYIQIEPAVHKGDLCTMQMMVLDKATQETVIHFSTNIPGATGTFTITQGGEVLGVLTPDENGRIERTPLYFTPKEDGKYAFTATYTPGLMDKVTIENPVYTSDEIELDIKGKIRVITYNDELKVEYDYEYICGNYISCSFILSAGNGYYAEDIETWEFYDQNGNKIEVFDENGNAPELKGMTRINFVVPDEESGITEIHCYPIGPWSPEDSFNSTPQDDSMLGSLLAFWQKLVNWLVSIYRTIVDFLIPSVETF